MLKQRVITAIILVLFTMAAIFWLPSGLFALLIFFVVLLGGWEWSRLTALHDLKLQGLFLAALALFALATYLSRGNLFYTLSMLALLTWLAILVMLSIYHQRTLFYQRQPWVLRLLAFPILLTAWAALIHLHTFKPAMVLYLILLIAVADTSAFFAGKRFGKNPLAPELSPKKTLEGMMGALVGTAIWALLGASYFQLDSGDWVYFILLSMVTVLLSIAGDLFESLLKRQAGEKDSGTILPGHGGVLDRMDSLLAAAPFFTLGIIWGEVVLYGGTYS
ncbi:MAG: phosphatidate cytidylyltransferase [bacterium]